MYAYVATKGEDEPGVEMAGNAWCAACQADFEPAFNATFGVTRLPIDEIKKRYYTGTKFDIHCAACTDRL